MKKYKRQLESEPQEVMGHKDVQTTLDIYAESTTEKKQEVINSLQGKIIIK